MKLLEVQNNLIDKMTAGERKRLVIAVELLRTPKVMFIDEPIT